MCAFNPIPNKFVSRILKISIFLFLAGTLVACGPSQREKDLRVENNQLIVEQGKLKEQLANTEIELQNAQSIAEKDQLNSDLKVARAATDEQHRSLEELQAQQAAIQSKMDSSLAENESLKQRLAELEGHTETLAKEKGSLNERLAQTANELGSAQTHAAELSSSYEVLLREKSNLAASDEAARSELERARQGLENAQTEVARLTGARGIYTVQNIDSLSTIAAFFYRNGSLWPKILQANSFLTTNPDLIFPGMVLIIPQ